MGPFWSDNRNLLYISKLEVIGDQTTSNFHVYNLQLPHITSNFLIVAMIIMVATVMVVMVVMLVMVVLVNMVVMVDRTGQTGEDRIGQDRTGEDKTDI